MSASAPATDPPSHEKALERQEGIIICLPTYGIKDLTAVNKRFLLLAAAVGESAASEEGLQ